MAKQTALSNDAREIVENYFNEFKEYADEQRKILGINAAKKDREKNETASELKNVMFELEEKITGEKRREYVEICQSLLITLNGIKKLEEEIGKNGFDPWNESDLNDKDRLLISLDYFRKQQEYLKTFFKRMEFLSLEAEELNLSNEKIDFLGKRLNENKSIRSLLGVKIKELENSAEKRV